MVSPLILGGAAGPALQLLSGRGNGNLTLGAAAPVNPSDVNPIAANASPSQPQQNTGLMQSLASGGLPAPNSEPGEISTKQWLALAAIDALRASRGLEGIGGETVMRKRETDIQNEQLKRQRLTQSLNLSSTLAQQANAITDPNKRTKFRETAKNTLMEAGDERAANLFDNLVDNPTVATTLGLGLIEQSPKFKALMKKDPTGNEALEWTLSDEGAKESERIADKTILPSATQKIQNLVSGVDQLVRDGHIDKATIDKVRADGKISIPEMQQISNNLPDNLKVGGVELKLTPEEFQTVTAERNREQLRTVGISLAEDFKPQNVRGTGQTVLDSQGNVVGQLADTPEGNRVQLPGGGLRPFAAGEFVSDVAEEASALTSAQTRKVEEAILEGQNQIDSLRRTAEEFDPSFLTMKGKLEKDLLQFKEGTGLFALDESEKEFVNQYNTFAQRGIEGLNLYINAITGAAIGAGQEEARLRAGWPDVQNDRPTQFIAKFNDKLEELQIEQQRLIMAKARGAESITEVPLSEVRRKIESGELVQARVDQLSDQGMAMEDILRQIESEFPMSALDKLFGVE